MQHDFDRRDTFGGYPAVVSDQDHSAISAIFSAVSIYIFQFSFSVTRR